ncbi:MAG: WD40 repeat domain-containing protein [Candidatus Poribacteria bacterium]
MKRKNTYNIMLVLICAFLFSSYLCFAKSDESKTIKHQYGVYSVRFSPDGKYLAIAGGQSILLYDMERNKLAKRWRPNFWIYAMDYAPDGEKIAVGGTTMGIPIYKLKTIRRPSKNLISGTVNFLDFSPDGRWLAAKNWGKPNAIVFDLTNNKKITFKLSPGRSWLSPRVQFSPNGRLFAAAGDPVIMWEVGSWRERGKLKGTDLSIAFSPSSLTLAVGTLNSNGEITFWRTSTGTKRLSFRSKRIENSTYIEFSPGGHYLAVAGGKGQNFAVGSTIEIWHIKKKRIVKVLEGHTGTITTLDFSRDGKWLASGSYDKTVRLWDVSTIADPSPKGVDATDKIATTWGQVK